MELLQAIHGRRSVREFTDEPVSDAMLHERTTPQFHIFYHALVLVVIAACRPTDWAVEDCALAAENMMLAAMSRKDVRARPAKPSANGIWLGPKSGQAAAAP